MPADKADGIKILLSGLLASQIQNKKLDRGSFCTYN